MAAGTLPNKSHGGKEDISDFKNRVQLVILFLPVYGKKPSLNLIIGQNQSIEAVSEKLYLEVTI